MSVFEENEKKILGPSVFMDSSDEKALKALKAIPGFTPLLKGFMSIWNERQYRIRNLSSHNHLGFYTYDLLINSP